MGARRRVGRGQLATFVVLSYLSICRGSRACETDTPKHKQAEEKDTTRYTSRSCSRPSRSLSARDRTLFSQPSNPLFPLAHQAQDGTLDSSSFAGQEAAVQHLDVRVARRVFVWVSSSSSLTRVEEVG